MIFVVIFSTVRNFRLVQFFSLNFVASFFFVFLAQFCDDLFFVKIGQVNILE